MTAKKRLQNKFDKLRFRYKLFILNEKTLEEVFKIELSRLTIFIYSGLAIFVVFVLLSVLIVFSPIKFYLPGFGDYALRGDISEKIAKIDSLSYQMDMQRLQLEVMKNIISGNLSVDSIPDQNTVKVDDLKKLVSQKSQTEKSFVENFQGKYMNSAINDIVPEKQESIWLENPLAGSISVVPTDIDNQMKITSVEHQVLAVANGSIVSSELSINNRHVVVLQHQDGYTTVYKNLGVVYLAVGKKVDKGDVIGEVYHKDKNSYLIFEIWQYGTRVNPKKLLRL